MVRALLDDGVDAALGNGKGDVHTFTVETSPHSVTDPSQSVPSTQDEQKPNRVDPRAPPEGASAPAHHGREQLGATGAIAAHHAGIEIGPALSSVKLKKRGPGRTHRRPVVASPSPGRIG